MKSYEIKQLKLYRSVFIAFFFFWSRNINVKMSLLTRIQYTYSTNHLYLFIILRLILGREIRT